MLRDDQIVEILELVDFRITKSELGAFFVTRNMKTTWNGDQVLRNFLNGLVIHLVLKKTQKSKRRFRKHKAQIPAKTEQRET
jgi:uncharacterized protein YehS (DUF1456 family)